MRGCFWRLHGTVEGSRVYLISVNDDLKVQTYPLVSCIRDRRVDASCFRRACSSRLTSFSTHVLGLGIDCTTSPKGHRQGFRVSEKHFSYSGRGRCLLGLYVPGRHACGISSIACGAWGRAAARSEVCLQ